MNLHLPLRYKEFLLSLFHEADRFLKKDRRNEFNFQEREIKIQIDKTLDDLFRKNLEANTGLPVYSEESSGVYPSQASTWIVDPLDGSLNYFRGIPFFTSSICLWELGRPILGAIYDYSLGDFYFAVDGEGAYLNERRLSLLSTENRKELLATGIPSHSSIPESLNLFSSNLHIYKKLRWFGCASLSLAYVAAGKVDAYEEKGIKIWDVAAGIALVKAAGGKVNYSCNFDGSLDVRAEVNG